MPLPPRRRPSIALHLERIGDLAVNVAELTKLAAGLPRDPVVVRNLKEMGATALGMVGEAMRAFADQDADACLALARDDDKVDMWSRAVLKRVLAIETPRERHRWASTWTRSRASSNGPATMRSTSPSRSGSW